MDFEFSRKKAFPPSMIQVDLSALHFQVGAAEKATVADYVRRAEKGLRSMSALGRVDVSWRCMRPLFHTVFFTIELADVSCIAGNVLPIQNHMLDEVNHWRTNAEESEQLHGLMTKSTSKHTRLAKLSLAPANLRPAPRIASSNKTSITHGFSVAMSGGLDVADIRELLY